MKIKIIFLKALMLSKKLSCLPSEEDNTGCVSEEGSRRTYICKPQTPQYTQPWVDLPSWQKAKFKSRPKLPNKITLVQIDSSRPEAVPKLFPDVLTQVKHFIVEPCCEPSWACLFSLPGGEMNSRSLEGYVWRGRWVIELLQDFPV